MRRGKFILFEGPNGCGKGTQIPLLVKKILDLDRSQTIFATREPNQFDNYGQKAREMLAREGDPYQNQLDALKYFSKSRKHHNSIFLPMLERGINVICDRYIPSTLAFQGAQGVEYEKILEANKKFRTPNLTFILDVPTGELIRRLSNRDGTNRRKFDSNQDFLDKVRKNYLKIPQLLPHWNIQFINGEKSPEQVHKEIWKKTRELFTDSYSS